MNRIPLLLLTAGLLSLGCARSTPGAPRGITVERIQAPASAYVRIAPEVTVVTIDLAVHSLELLTEQEFGGSRTPEAWAREHGLTGAINASMHLPNGRSAGFMLDDDRVNNGQDNPAYGGFLAFDPRDPDHPPAVLAGRDCEGFELADLRRRYRSVLQGYRLLDCGGAAQSWADPKLYSAAAVALDREGRVVLIHTGRAWRMSEFANWLATDRQLAGAIFVEGGPEAGLYVDLGADVIRAIGTYEGIPHASRFREIPNVLGFRPRR